MNAYLEILRFGNAVLAAVAVILMSCQLFYAL